MLLEKLQPIEDRFQEINQELLEVGDDYQRATELSIEKSDLESIIEKAREYKSVLEQIDADWNRWGRPDLVFNR